ncbi:MAG: hypothetical protein ABI693_26615 [Bryobacteraceae bacterium]
MISTTNAATSLFLTDLDRTQKAYEDAQRQATSGLRIQLPSDDPTVVQDILDLQTNISQNQQIQTNLQDVKIELQAADGAIQSATKIMDRLSAIALQGASSTSTAQDRLNLAQETRSLQDQLVQLSRTNISGHYIFSGDQSDQPSYQLDTLASNGVTQLVAPTNTRRILTTDGSTLTVSMTAQQLFDTGTATTGNVFAAVQALATALETNSDADLAASVDNLRGASQYLNQQVPFYGAAQNRVSDAMDLAHKSQVQQQATLSADRDADMAKVAVTLTQIQIQLEASLQSRAKYGNRSLFDYLA